MRALSHASPLGLLLVAALAACTGPHKLISARHISCAPRKLEIHDLISMPTREDWIAVCEDKRYACYTRERGRRLIYGCRPLAALDAGTAADAAAADAALPLFAAPAEAGTPALSDAAEISLEASAP